MAARGTRERLAQASVSRVIRRVVYEDTSTKRQDLANGRISVCVCASVLQGKAERAGAV